MEEKLNRGRSLRAMLRERGTDREALPYERFRRFGPETLTDAELLAIIIRTGSARRTPTEIAGQVLALGHTQEHGLNGLYHISLEDLMRIDGIGEVKATKLKCIAELSRRMAADRTRRGLGYDRPARVAAYYMERLRHEEQERVLLICLNAKLQALDETVISTGTVNRTLLSPREVFRHAVRQSAVSIMLLHNHPSGDPTPSGVDLAITERIRRAGEMMDIPLIDHIIIGDCSYVSLAEQNLLQEADRV